jgi:hypothetical protein
MKIAPANDLGRLAPASEVAGGISQKKLFSFAGLVLISLLFVYYFCTIFVIQQKN